MDAGKTKESKSGAVNIALDDLSNIIISLEENIKSLENRLRPILSSSPPITEVEKEKDSIKGCCFVSQLLFDNVRFLKKLRNKIEELNSRAEV